MFRHVKLVVQHKKFTAHKRHMILAYKLSLRFNIQKAFGLKTNNLFCKMIIGLHPKMMDFITHGLRHCVIGVGKDSGVMGVDKDSGHGT